ncbi:hypothetical protein [Helicobacter sp. 12S02232-10]|uniref:hypothetical protein n=1 Tax=Helicobacter sp. 12S02232-10 TaxID=1476197 RepID=UPI0015DE55CB|nr:hypothetical protein [Helicobacter sp. 12S02232-10]
MKKNKQFNSNPLLIKGKKADYSPRWFFEFEGKIYQKFNFERAYQRNFIYPIIDDSRR